MPSDSTLVRDVRDHAGESLRVVAKYDGDDVDFHYLRDDVADEYTLEEIDDVREYILLEGIAEPHLESLFHGRELRCRTFAFEDIHVFHFSIDDARGLFVAVDTGGVDDFEAFVNDCLEHARTLA